MADDAGVPSRLHVEAAWRELIAGVASRDEVHRWVVPWVEDRWAEILDPPTQTALETLHGFDLTCAYERLNVVRHGPGERYVHTDEHIVRAFERWLVACQRYDADPDGNWAVVLTEDGSP